MKTWNTPDVKEVEFTETANGFFNTSVETLFLLNDSKAKSSTPDSEIKEPDVTEDSLS